MNPPQSVLFELGTEELPAYSLGGLRQALGDAVQAGLRDAGLSFSSPVRTFASPRRLAVSVQEVAAQTESSTTVRKGPQRSAAFDADGEPTSALRGFARSCEASEEQIERWRAGEDRIKNDKGEWLTFEQHIPPSSCIELLPKICAAAVSGLALEKRMRWGESEVSFLRPVRWVVLLYGDAVVDGDIMGLRCGRTTRGHRQLSDGPVDIPSADEYEATLRESAKVWADECARRQEVERQVAALPFEQAQEVCMEAMLEVSCARVEYPVALIGTMEAQDRALPDEIIRAVVEEQQGYFVTRDSEGALTGEFVLLANVPDPDGVIAAGAAKVVRARLRDAAFYLERDRRRRLEDRVADLGRVTYHRKLGTVLERTERIGHLAGALSSLLEVEDSAVTRAAQLCKADLGTDVVQSFPNLQGLIGARYAREDGEDDAVCVAIEEHYRPRRANDTLPASAAGQILALADRLDMLAGVCCVGEIPDGARDPLGVRRAAYGVLRLAIECSLELDVEAALTRAVARYPEGVQDSDAVASGIDYLSDRMRGYAVEHGQSRDVIEAALAVSPARPLEALRRMQAVAEFKSQASMEILAGTHKRIRNILRTAEDVDGALQAEYLQQEQERLLAQTLEEVREGVLEACARKDYAQALDRLLVLAKPVAEFFDEVLVMADEVQIRHNRLRLLRQLQDLFLNVADFSCLHI